MTLTVEGGGLQLKSHRATCVDQLHSATGMDEHAGIGFLASRCVSLNRSTSKVLGAWAVW